MVDSDLDEKFGCSANDCRVLDEVAVCDEFEEFSKLANNDSTTLHDIHGQFFKNCWSMICCSVGHEVQTSGSTMAMEDIWKACYASYQLSLQSMPTRFKTPDFLHSASSKVDADEHGRQKWTIRLATCLLGLDFKQ